MVRGDSVPHVKHVMLCVLGIVPGDCTGIGGPCRFEVDQQDLLESAKLSSNICCNCEALVQWHHQPHTLPKLVQLLDLLVVVGNIGDIVTPIYYFPVFPTYPKPLTLIPKPKP